MARLSLYLCLLLLIYILSSFNFLLSYLGLSQILINLLRELLYLGEPPLDPIVLTLTPLQEIPTSLHIR